MSALLLTYGLEQTNRSHRKNNCSCECISCTIHPFAHNNRSVGQISTDYSSHLEYPSVSYQNPCFLILLMLKLNIDDLSHDM